MLLALDADSAGQEAMLRAARVAAWSQLALRVVPLPEGLDPADVVTTARAPRRRARWSSARCRSCASRSSASWSARDLTHAEGKDSVIAALRPVFATLPPSALREELLAHVVDAIDLPPAMVSSWLPVPASARRAGAPARRRRRAPRWRRRGRSGGGGGGLRAPEEPFLAGPPGPARWRAPSGLPRAVHRDAVAAADMLAKLDNQTSAPTASAAPSTHLDRT